MLSFERLGSQENWPASHSDPAVQDSLQHLSNENTYLRQQLAARADTKFVQGILQKSVENVQLVHVGSNTDLVDHCMKLESERVNLKREVYHLKLMLNSTYPGAMTVKFLQDQLAADMRLREYQSMQHNDVNTELHENSTDLKALTDEVSKLAEQNNLLLSLIDTKTLDPQQVSIIHTVLPHAACTVLGLSSQMIAANACFALCCNSMHKIGKDWAASAACASQTACCCSCVSKMELCLQVSQGNSAASDSPMIAAGTDAPFGKASDSAYDPYLPRPHHHSQSDARRQRNFRRGSRPRSAKNRNAPLHESRLSFSQDADVPAEQVIISFCVFMLF